MARLVLRPAVEARFAPALGTALAPIGPQCRAAPIIGLDLADDVALAITVLDDGGRERQPRRDLAGLLGPADAQSGDRHGARRQIERFGDDPGIIPDRADRAGAKPDGGRGLDERRHHDRTIDRRVEERIEVVVREWLVTPPRHHRQPRAVADEDQEHGRIHDPGHLRDGVDDRLPDRGLAHDDNVGLLQVAFGRRRKRAGAQEPQQIGLDWPGQEAPMRAMPGDPGEFREAGKSGIDRKLLAEALGERLLDCGSRVGHELFLGLSAGDAAAIMAA